MFKIRKRNHSTLKILNQKSNQQNKCLNRYKCLKEISDAELHWKNLLKNELQMGSTIVAFQNVQISMRVDAQKKLILRQTFMLKKEIIRLIVNEKFSQILQKLEFLRKTSPSDSNLATLFINFYNIRQSIMNRNLEYNLQTVKQIKQKILQTNEKLQKQKSSIIYGRTLYIAALHLIRLNGVLIKNEDIQIVVQALNSKKKQLCMISSQINKVTLQSLLFLTFQFYKILYLLKRDQDLIIQYFNQIQAFISIYRTKCQNFQEFQSNFKIAQKIQKMRPLNINLKIYDDHDRRRALSLQNTQLQLMKNHFALRTANVLSTQISAEIKNHQAKKISLSRNNSLQSSYQKTQRSESKINQSSATIAIEKAIQIVVQKSQQNLDLDMKFCFQFIKPCLSSILLGKFQTRINLQLNQFTITIKLFKIGELIGYFTMSFILEKKRNLNDYGKKLWRTIKQKFYTDKTQFLPNLFSFQYPPISDLPINVDTTYQLPILVRIHQILLHYLRKQPLLAKINGLIIQFPQTKSQLQQKQKQKQINQAQMKIFAKRHGFISFNKKIRNIRTLHLKNSQSLLSHTNIFQNQNQYNSRIILFKKQQSQQPSIIYFQFNNATNTIINLKLCNINSYKNSGNLLKQKKLYTSNQLNLITYKKDVQKLLKMIKSQFRKKKILILIQKLQELSNEESYVFGGINVQNFMNNNFSSDKQSIEQEFQVMKSPVLQTKHNVIKQYRKKYPIFLLKSQILTQNHQFLPRKTIKLQQKYLPFYQQSFPTYTRYFDNKKQFIICNENKQNNYQILYRKYNLYKNIIFKTKNQNYYIKISCIKRKNIDNIIINNPTQIKILKQFINLKWIKTKIFKNNNKNNNNNIKNIYFCNIFQYGQNILISIYSFKNGKKLYTIIQKQIFNNFSFVQWYIDEQQMLLNNKIQIKQYHCNIKNICDIQQYLNDIQHQQHQESYQQLINMKQSYQDKNYNDKNNAPKMFI